MAERLTYLKEIFNSPVRTAKVLGYRAEADILTQQEVEQEAHQTTKPEERQDQPEIQQEEQDRPQKHNPEHFKFTPEAEARIATLIRLISSPQISDAELASVRETAHLTDEELIARYHSKAQQNSDKQ